MASRVPFAITNALTPPTGEFDRVNNTNHDAARDEDADSPSAPTASDEPSPSSSADEDRFFLVANAAARAGFAADIIGVASTCTSARGEEDLWGRVARVRTGAGQRTRLMFAAAHGDTQRLAFLLARAAPLYERDISGEAITMKSHKGGRTALLWAAANGHESCAANLLDAIAADAARAPPNVSPTEHGAEAVDDDGAGAMHLAATGGHLNVVRLLLGRGFAPDKLDTVGRSPLYFAAREGHCEVVEVLLAAGARAECVRDDGWSAFLIAVQEGHVRIAELLAEAGADVARSAPPADDTWNALHVSAYRGHGEMLTALLSGRIRGGASLDPLSTDISGAVPLYYSCSRDAVSALLGARDGAARRAQLLARTRTGKTVLHSYYRHSSAAQALIAAADREGVLFKLLRTRCARGNTPLLTMASEHGEIAVELIAAGADARVRSASGETVIGAAVSNRDESAAVRVVRAALCAGADPRAVWRSEPYSYSDSDCALAHAARMGRTSLVEQLLRAGAGRSYALRIPARVAAAPSFLRPRAFVCCFPIAPPSLIESAGNAAIVDIALARGAHPTGSAVEYAMLRNREDVVVRLLAAGAPATRRALLEALSNNNAACARSLIRSGAELKTVATRDCASDMSHVGFFDFRSRLGSGDINDDAELEDTLKLLVENGCIAANCIEVGPCVADGLLHRLVDAGRPKRVLAAAVALGAQVDGAFARGQTPLLRAVMSARDVSTVTNLLELGAAPSGPPNALIPPLTAAAMIGRLDAVAALLAAGALPTAATLFLTAYGATAGAPAVIEALVAAGAEVDGRGVAGTTPLLAAVKAAARAGDASSSGHSPARATRALAIVEALINAGADARLADAAGCTPLHAAACGAPVEVLFVLARARGGDDIDAIDARGATPLVIAAAAGDRRCATVLLSLGADARGAPGGIAPSVAARVGRHARLAEVLDQAARVAGGESRIAPRAMYLVDARRPLDNDDFAKTLEDFFEDGVVTFPYFVIQAARRVLKGGLSVRAAAENNVRARWAWPWKRSARVAAEA